MNNTLEFKDMYLHRDGRIKSDVVQTWLSQYKEGIMSQIVFGIGKPYLNQELVSEVNNHPEAVEIAVDTIIGWLNSHVGRCFLRDAFNIEIPTADPKGTD